jgi:hypothetical protein
MNHLDVGFDGIDPYVGFASNVVNYYFTVYFPRAIATANALKKVFFFNLKIFALISISSLTLLKRCPATFE